MSSILVTGGAGFIGSHLAEALQRRGHRVVVLDDLSGGFAENLTDGARLIRGSILDVELLTRLFEDHAFDYVYHLAAYAAEGLSHFIKRFNYTNNVIGSVNLINADAVFGNAARPSGLWQEVGPARAKSRGLDPAALQDFYRQRNLLKATVTPEHVGNAVVFFATNQTPTTGATLPVDGGVAEAFPR